MTSFQSRQSRKPCPRASLLPLRLQPALEGVGADQLFQGLLFLDARLRDGLDLVVVA